MEKIESRELKKDNEEEFTSDHLESNFRTALAQKPCFRESSGEWEVGKSRQGVPSSVYEVGWGAGLGDLREKVQ